MEPWIFITLLAALAQTVRFVLQKKLTVDGLSPSGATYARFLFAAPVVAVITFIHAKMTIQPIPNISNAFWAYVVTGGTAQVLATICTVMLFSMRNFAVGITFAKTEVLLSALVGFVVLSDGLSATAIVAILVGLPGVLLLSKTPAGGRVLTRSAGLGLLAGLLFAVSGVAYRGASLSLMGGDAFLRAALTLACVTAFQTVLMTLAFALRDPKQIAAVFRKWRVAALVAGTSLIGSLGWFTAFTLQTAALVKAVGQVELVFSIAASWLIFSETITRREMGGIILVLASVVILISGG